MSRNPIARDLRTPKYRMRVITSNRRIDRMAAFADLQAQYLEALEADDEAGMDQIERDMREFKETANAD